MAPREPDGPFVEIQHIVSIPNFADDNNILVRRISVDSGSFRHLSAWYGAQSSSSGSTYYLRLGPQTTPPRGGKYIPVRGVDRMKGVALSVAKESKFTLIW